MKFEVPLIQGIFLKRYKRFFADIQLGSEIVIAHVANTGSMKSCNQPGQPCLLSRATNPERKLKFSLEAIQAPSEIASEISGEGNAASWVGVNTAWPNYLVKEALANKSFSHWNAFDAFKSEVKLNAETRIDFVLENTNKGRKRYLEVKNVSLALGDFLNNKGIAQFPDSVTERGQKHLRELIKMVNDGHQAEIFFCVQRSDCSVFSPADDIDPEYGKLLRQAHQAGVLVTAAVVDFSPTMIALTGKTIPIHL